MGALRWDPIAMRERAGTIEQFKAQLVEHSPGIREMIKDFSAEDWVALVIHAEHARAVCGRHEDKFENIQMQLHQAIGFANRRFSGRAERAMAVGVLTHGDIMIFNATLFSWFSGRSESSCNTLLGEMGFVRESTRIRTNQIIASLLPELEHKGLIRQMSVRTREAAGGFSLESTHPAREAIPDVLLSRLPAAIRADTRHFEDFTGDYRGAVAERCAAVREGDAIVYFGIGVGLARTAAGRASGGWECPTGSSILMPFGAHYPAALELAKTDGTSPLCKLGFKVYAVPAELARRYGLSMPTVAIKHEAFGLACEGLADAAWAPALQVVIGHLAQSSDSAG